MGRYFMSKYGFRLGTFLSVWFLTYFFIRSLATMGQLYVFTSFELGRTITLAGVLGLITANILGLFLLKEILSPIAYIGIAFAIIAFLLVGFSR